jgi:murein DD-endopeptidase MepM/ murein hydrolase activator NlpD
VHARNDRPDQPDANASDPRYFAPEFQNGGDVGNHVVIDHGNSEFSMIAHFQAGSVLVRASDHVRQGEPIGKLGASGEATGPHVHYQLQAGPDWQYADGLPCTFHNVDQPALVRGVYFEAQ